MKIQKTNINYAILSGCCASAASLFGKLSGLPTFQDLLIIRIIFFMLMLLFNGFVWTLFVKALHDCKSTLIATVLSTASNYILSAITGFLVFNELTGLLWWSGMCLNIMGLLLVLRDQNQADIAIKKGDDRAR